MGVVTVGIDLFEGTLAKVTGTFKDEDGVLTDPDTITLRFTPNQGVESTIWTYGGTGSITRTGTGVYLAPLDTTGLPGVWLGAWLGTGACQVTQPFTFPVAELPV